MRTDIPAPTTTTNRKRATILVVYPITETPREVLLGTASGGVDYTAYVTSMVQSSTGVEIRITLPSAINTPIAGQCVSITDTLNGSSIVVFNGVIESANSPRNARGADKSITIIARRRDAANFYRRVNRVTDEYYMGTDLGRIARDIASQAGLEEDEYDLPNTGVCVAHSIAQLGDLPFWGMLEACGQPGILQPYVNSLGKFKWISRDIRRKPDYELTDWSTVLEVGASSTNQKPTAVRVKYTSPQMVRVNQQRRILATGQLTCNMFKGTQKLELYWSDDHKQRADVEASDFVKAQSVNDGVLGDVGDESFTVTSPFGGRIDIVANEAMNAAAFTALGITLATAMLFPDPVVTGGLFVQGGATVPSGGSGYLKIAIITSLLYMITRTGTGIYNIYGVPYDFVHEVNQVEAYDSAAVAQQEEIVTIESSLIPSQDIARSVAQAELLYRVKAANGGSFLMVDDYRVECADIYLLPDATRVFVEDFSRNLTPGAPAELEIMGFFT